jgi:hypothetical protein
MDAVNIGNNRIFQRRTGECSKLLFELLWAACAQHDATNARAMH